MNDFKSYNLLFLEDNLSFAKNSIDYFSLLFNKIYHTTTIEKAIDVFDKKIIHLIITDIKVDDGNGLDFVKLIRGKNKEIPIIVLSAHKDEEFLFSAIPLNLCDYLIKPISHDNLMKSLKKADVLMKQLYMEKKLIKNGFYYNKKECALETEQKDKIFLTEKESLLIDLFLRYPNQVITKEMIERQVYVQMGMSDSALKNLLLRIRKKTTQDFIKTVVGLGYKL